MSQQHKSIAKSVRNFVNSIYFNVKRLVYNHHHPGMTTITISNSNPSFVDVDVDVDKTSSPKTREKDENARPMIVWQETKIFIPPIKMGYVIKVYDGDTITIAVEFPFEPNTHYRFSVRLAGIDAPEIRGKSEDEILAAQCAKDEMTRLVLNKTVLLENISFEKYGRLLADVYVNSQTNKERIHVNAYMLDKRLCVAYDGGKKSSPVSWVKYTTTGIA